MRQSQAQASASDDLSAFLTAQDTRLGAARGTIVLDHPGRIGTPVTLHRGHGLELRAAVAWAATVHLEGDNRVACFASGHITAELPGYEFPKTAGMLLLAEGASGIQVTDCVADSKAQSVFLAGYPIANVTMTGNVLHGMTLVVTNGPAAGRQGPITSTNLVLSENQVSMPAHGSNNAAMLLFFAKGVTANDNVFTDVVHGVQWWGGNSGDAGAKPAQVTQAGQMRFTGNSCKSVSGSCIWGSMGSDIVMRGNTADGCGDVCFDTEGGLRTQIIENTASGCVNGCAAVFFFTDQTLIAGNHFRGAAPGGGLILVKNASQDPAAHDHLRIENNDLRCEPGVCRAMYMEAAGGVSFVANQVTDGVFLPVGYGRAVVIARNRFVLNKALTPGAAVIQAPAVLGGTALEVLDNTIETRVAQPEGSACIAGSWSDFNAVDVNLIAGNRCFGTGHFPVGLRVVSEGENAGIAGVWVLSANRLGGGRLEHVAKTPNERFFDMGECGTDAGSGCRVNAAGVAGARALGGCAGAAPAATARTVPVCLGAGRGWALVPLAR